MKTENFRILLRLVTRTVVICYIRLVDFDSEHLEMNGSSFINNKCCHGSLAQQRIYFHTQTDETSSGLNYGPPMYQYSQKLISSDSATCDGMFNCHLTKFLPSLMRRQTHYPAYGLTDVHDVPTLGSFTYQSPINESLIHPCVSFNGTFCDQPTPKAFPKPIIYNYNPQPQFTQPRFSNENRFIGEAALDRVNGLNKQNYFRSTKVNKQSENAKASVKYQDRNKKLDFKINFRDEHRKVNGCFHRDDKLANKTKSDASAPPPKKMWIRHYMTGKSETYLFTTEGFMVMSTFYLEELTINSLDNSLSFHFHPPTIKLAIR